MGHVWVVLPWGGVCLRSIIENFPGPPSSLTPALVTATSQGLGCPPKLPPTAPQILDSLISPLLSVMVRPDTIGFGQLVPGTGKDGKKEGLMDRWADRQTN